MKRIGVLLILTCTIFGNRDCQICIEPKWDNLEQSELKEKRFGGKLMLVGSFTFRKRCKDCIKLDKLILGWHGKSIDRLCGSLYKKNPEKDFYPIQENLICDAQWNKASQSLIFDFDNTQTLNALSIFYLVLIVPDPIAPLLKDGHFELKKTGLPEMVDFREQKLDLAVVSDNQKSFRS